MQSNTFKNKPINENILKYALYYLEKQTIEISIK